MLAHDRIFAYHRAIHDGRTDADQTIVADCTAVKRRMMGDGAIGSDHRGRFEAHMNHHKILEIGVVANRDRMDLGPGHRVRPKRNTAPNADVAVEERSRMDKRGFRQIEHCALPYSSSSIGRSSSSSSTGGGGSFSLRDGFGAAVARLSK